MKDYLLQPVGQPEMQGKNAWYKKLIRGSLSVMTH